MSNKLTIYIRLAASAVAMFQMNLAAFAGGEFTTVINPTGNNGEFEFHSTECSTGKPVKVEWLPHQRLNVLDNCVETVEAPSSACPTGEINVFLLVPQGNQPPIFAESIAIRDKIIAFETFKPWSRSIGPLSEIRSVTKANVCRNILERVPITPGGFCTESRQVAVAFDYGTPLSNRILTNGFSYRLKSVGPVPIDFDETRFEGEVANAFQGALTLWMAALSDNPELLTESVANFIKDRTLTSDSGYRMLIPPQVVQVKCKGNETFVIELNFGGTGLFPPKGVVLARAKLEGRTIAINLSRYKCFRSEKKYNDAGLLRFMLGGDCFNLLPIMTHELGHAFGLHHFDNGGPHALMSERFYKDALTPTMRDVSALVEVLDASITGAAAGVLEFMPSNGVSAPIEFEGRNLR